MAIKETNIFSPYDAQGRCNLKGTGIGVYIIYKERRGIKTPIYVGKSLSDVKSTMYRHFQKWTDRRHPDRKRTELYERVTYWTRGGFDQTGYYCRVLFTNSERQANVLEYLLIKKYNPEDNTNKQLAFEGMDIATVADFYTKRKKIQSTEEDPF